MSTECEKSSLLTVVRLLNKEQENISCTSKKCKSCQEQQAQNSWRVAETKTKSRREDRQINLQNKFSTLLIEDDEEAEKDSIPDYNQTLPQNRTSQLVNEQQPNETIEQNEQTIEGTS